MSLVLDSSAALAWYFEDERTDAVTAVLRQVAEDGAVVPAIWPLEVANGLLMAIRRRRIEAAFANAAIGELRALLITIDAETNTYAWGETFGLAGKFGLTLYDAAYLELAQRRGLPLASLDGRLRAAASELAIPVLGL